MEVREPFLASHHSSRLNIILPSSLDDSFIPNPSPNPNPKSDFSFTPTFTFHKQDIEEVQDRLSNSYNYKQYEDENSSSSSSSSSLLSAARSNYFHQKSKVRRCKTAPAMTVMRESLLQNPKEPKPSQFDSNSLVRQAALLLVLYLSLGVIIYSFNRDHFSGLETHPVVDALYFCIVTMCTIGYGDITPLTPSAKLFSCFFVLVGFGFIDVLLSGVVNYVLDLQENMILSSIKMDNKGVVEEDEGRRKRRFSFSPIDYIFDFAKGRMRIRWKVGMALGVVMLSIGMGTLVLFFVESLDWIDSLYLSVMSVTTVGYGDRAFKTLSGRLFASIWLLCSTLTVARAFLYLAEARIDKRHRRITNWVLHRQITVQDLLAADINHSGFLSKSEYIVFKLKEMGKIGEKDILQICAQFNKLDSNNFGKITLPHLLAGRL